MSIIYHITTKSEWQAAQATGKYEAFSLKDEGYIHCSEERQVDDVLKRYFKTKTDLLKLVIDTNKLSSPLIYDWSPSIEDTFPHIYGPINVDAVTEVIPISSATIQH
jgi:uncharacterized protein (DUF952 family)